MPHHQGPRKPVSANRILTNSRISTLLTCPYRHYLRYELGFRPDTDALALRFGTAWHKAMEYLAAGVDAGTAYDMAVSGKTDFEEIDLAKLTGMIGGYAACYPQSLAVRHNETPFSFAVSHGRGAMWVMGVIDGITENPCWVVERKTTASDISEQSDYWTRLRGDRQVQIYVMGARSIGFDPESVIYDVARKPAIRQKQTETVDEYADRLLADTRERPDFYFSRREIPIIESDINRVYAELEQTASDISHRRKCGIWQRNVTERTCPGCEFSGPCLSGVKIDPASPPAGFTVGSIFPELEAAGIVVQNGVNDAD